MGLRLERVAVRRKFFREDWYTFDLGPGSAGGESPFWIFWTSIV